MTTLLVEARGPGFQSQMASYIPCVFPCKYAHQYPDTLDKIRPMPQSDVAL